MMQLNFLPSSRFSSSFPSCLGATARHSQRSVLVVVVVVVVVENNGGIGRRIIISH